MKKLHHEKSCTVRQSHSSLFSPHEVSSLQRRSPRVPILKGISIFRHLIRDLRNILKCHRLEAKGICFHSAKVSENPRHSGTVWEMTLEQVLIYVQLNLFYGQISRFWGGRLSGFSHTMDCDWRDSSLQGVMCLTWAGADYQDRYLTSSDQNVWDKLASRGLCVKIPQLATAIPSYSALAC